MAAQRLTFERLPGRGDAAADEALHRDVADGFAWEPSRMTRYLAARTRFFDAAVTGWSGPQVVALGAGYDGRSLRYAGARWWELDHPATQEDKLTRLARLGIETSTTFVAADFLTDTWTLPGHDPSLPTLFLCEGVLAYLPDPARLLTWAASVAAPGSSLVAEVAVSGAASDTSTAMRSTVASVGEAMAEPWERSSLGSRFSSYRWTLVTAVDARGASIESSDLTAALVTACPLED